MVKEVLELVSTKWLEKNLGSKDLRVLDASWYLPSENRNPKREFSSRHIAGSKYFDINSFSDPDDPLPHMVPSQERFCFELSKLDVSAETHVVFYDGSKYSENLTSSFLGPAWAEELLKFLILYLIFLKRNEFNEPMDGLVYGVVVSLGFEPQAWMTIPIWNNLFLMAIMIWIQTGLAMVIFSAALRGIPKEMIEAARIDGASEFKIFTSIIIPYLEKTILVIWTIITILVLKIFDIILAMTNGQWNTEVLANLMYDWMFRGGGDSGRGSLMAIVIMIGVIPIMIWNIRRHKEDEKS